MEILVTLFSGSQFLTEILLRNPAYFERLIAYRRMAVPKSVEQLYAEAQEAARAHWPIPARSWMPCGVFKAGSCCASAPATCWTCTTCRR